MLRLRPAARAATLAWPLAFAVPLAAQLPAGFAVSGYGEVSYAYSTQAQDGLIVAHLYDRFHDQFTLNALAVAAEREMAVDSWDAGFRFDMVVGQNAAVLQSSGLSLGPHGDLTQAYISLNVPTGDGKSLRFKLGKFVTLMGFEVIETIANPNWSEGLQFIFVENFTHTGVEAAFDLGSSAAVQLRVTNGWDRVGGSDHKDFMGRLGITPGESTSIGLVAYYGAQQDGLDAKRYGWDLVVSRELGAVSLTAQADWGTEQANPATGNVEASWWALGLWLARDLSEHASGALRLDYLADENGFRTGLGTDHRLWSATATVTVKRWPNVLLRPELRLDRSTLRVFDGEQSQFVMALSAAYTF